MLGKRGEKAERKEDRYKRRERAVVKSKRWGQNHVTWSGTDSCAPLFFRFQSPLYNDSYPNWRLEGGYMTGGGRGRVVYISFLVLFIYLREGGLIAANDALKRVVRTLQMLDFANGDANWLPSPCCGSLCADNPATGQRSFKGGGHFRVPLLLLPFPSCLSTCPLSSKPR